MTEVLQPCLDMRSGPTPGLISVARGDSLVLTVYCCPVADVECLWYRSGFGTIERATLVEVTKTGGSSSYTFTEAGEFELRWCAHSGAADLAVTATVMRRGRIAFKRTRRHTAVGGTRVHDSVGVRACHPPESRQLSMVASR